MGPERYRSNVMGMLYISSCNCDCGIDKVLVQSTALERVKYSTLAGCKAGESCIAFIVS
jgi:hypothetical protein